jgi:hypothetical protein
MRLSRFGVALPLFAALAGCTPSSPNVVGTAFPVARMSRPESRIQVEPGNFTMDRVLGRPDGLEPLGPDQSLNLFESDGRSLRDLLDVEGTRPNIFEQMERGGRAPDEPPPPPPPRRRGSSTPPQASAIPELEPRTVAPPPPAPPPTASRTLPPGTTIPGPAGGTVVGGSAGSTATTIGPSGRPGTATRDGGTVTLFGADGSIRTVPAPQR